MRILRIVLPLVLLGVISTVFGYRAGVNAGVRRERGITVSRMLGGSTYGRTLLGNLVKPHLDAPPAARVVGKDRLRYSGANGASKEWWIDWVWAEREITLDITDAYPALSGEQRMKRIYEFYRGQIGAWRDDASWTEDQYGRPVAPGIFKMWGDRVDKDNRQLVRLRLLLYCNRLAEDVLAKDADQHNFGGTVCDMGTWATSP